MVDVQNSQVLAEQFAEADAISRLEGYNPSPFEQSQKQRIIDGEIGTEEFIQIMVKHVTGSGGQP